MGSREEQEKLNVWVALLNLENMYGTEESLKKVFERALQFCEPMPVYQQLADIYAKSEKIKVRSSVCLNAVHLLDICRNCNILQLLMFLVLLSCVSAGGREPV